MKRALVPDVRLAVQRLKALADEKRLGILAQLAGGERCVCELTGSLGAAQSLLSFHLRTLKEAGLVTDRREGRWVHYAISAEGFAELEAFLAGVRAPARVTSRGVRPHVIVNYSRVMGSDPRRT
jgi:ArsR family transcriptional regulator, arsenate/arsenite/antimonite-responsive transcriptional repressor